MYFGEKHKTHFHIIIIVYSKIFRLSIYCEERGHNLFIVLKSYYHHDECIYSLTVLVKKNRCKTNRLSVNVVCINN